MHYPTCGQQWSCIHCPSTLGSTYHPRIKYNSKDVSPKTNLAPAMKELCRCYQVMDCKRRRLSWIIQVVPTLSLEPFKEEKFLLLESQKRFSRRGKQRREAAEGELRKIQSIKRTWPSTTCSKDKEMRATNQKMLVASRSWELPANNQKRNGTSVL